MDDLTDFLTDRCKITGPVEEGDGVLNETTLQMVYPSAPVRYEGPCKLSDRVANRQVSGIAPAQVDEYTLTLPPDVDTVRVGDEADVGGVGYDVIRAPGRSLKLSTRIVLQRTVSVPTTG